jgi:hypothetical protein
MPGLHLREGVILTINEAIIYDELNRAAHAGTICPNYLDLNEACGLESSSASPSIVKRLERKGLILVLRFQRFRRVKIVATGQWTARSPSQHVERAHVPRGARSASYPSGGLIAKKARMMK